MEAADLDAPYNYTYTVNHAPTRKIMGFSEEETKHIAIAVGVLTLAFTVIFSGGIKHILSSDPLEITVILLISFIAVITAFLFHELGHKFVAQRYGLWAEFRSWNLGLLFALFGSFMGFLFAAPGAVYIRGYVTKEQNGKISAAGPAMNIIVLGAAMVIFVFSSGVVSVVAFYIAYINTFIGGFNMIPFPPLDGSKIVKWSIPTYVSMLAVFVVSYLLLTYLQT